MRALFVFGVLLSVKILSLLFYRVEWEWVGEPLDEPWSGLRIAALIHHTSLFEPLFLAVIPTRLLWRIARRGVVPGADKTLARPLVGLFFRVFAHRVVPITRRRDHTWEQFLAEIGPDALVVMAPEGRMMRPSGLDLEGNRMTVRGGIADILQALGRGRLLLAYSGGLHHVQVPGQLPRVFRTVHLNLEILEIEPYLAGLQADADPSHDALKKAVIRDLEQRRSRYCPITVPAPSTTNNTSNDG